MPLLDCELGVPERAMSALLSAIYIWSPIQSQYTWWANVQRIGDWINISVDYLKSWKTKCTGQLRRWWFYLGYCNRENVHFVKEREGVWAFTELDRQGRHPQVSWRWMETGPTLAHVRAVSHFPAHKNGGISLPVLLSRNTGLRYSCTLSK